jgi:signal transduction histidine kinase
MDIGILIVVGVVSAVAGVVAGRMSARAGVEQGRREARTHGFEAGRAEAGAEAERQMRGLVDAIAKGRKPETGDARSAVGELRRALEAGWAPRDQERQAALGEAVGRVSAFLKNAVRPPLAGAPPSADAQELRERIERALGAIQDLDFFTKEPVLEGENKDLSAVAQQVTREFAQDQGVGIRLSLDDRPVRARVNAATLMDALYLVLHNAARFGGAATLAVAVLTEGGAARIRVRDRGPGFSEEALRKAFDPFYSTAEDGLGLGLPHARRIVEGMGGRIELRNAAAGGGEVEISFPAL